MKRLHEILSNLPKVRIIKSHRRLGLMQARVLGCVNAKGPVLIVMDSHVEVGVGWLPPLLDPIAKNPKTVTLPGIERLQPQTLEYDRVIFDQYNWVGGFNWKLMYTWTEFPRPNRSETPMRSPTMLGAAFAIRKDYFEYLGYYDTGFELWGGENLELSFKVWMCGGQMFQVFCSHVGHMYRERPYWVRI
jgi:polypeptide N-acetylgalactosaminyltransferase